MLNYFGEYFVLVYNGIIKLTLSHMVPLEFIVLIDFGLNRHFLVRSIQSKKSESGTSKKPTKSVSLDDSIRKRKIIPAIRTTDILLTVDQRTREMLKANVKHSVEINKMETVFDFKPKKSYDMNLIDSMIKADQKIKQPEE
ncbi:hypothetical protein SNEBB_005985 [Seison nebaliae]|nr:hypothetical protein SNEBB_005985 [Seison nebaliae]